MTLPCKVYLNMPAAPANTTNHPSTPAVAVSVVVPVFNGGSVLRRCLESLASCVPAPHEIIVVSDGDSEGSGELAAQFGARVLTVATNRGPAWARNAGAREAVGDVLFFVDADVLVYPDAVARVADAFADDEKVDAIFGSYDDQPGAANFCSQYKNLLNHFMHQRASDRATTFWSACGAVRRDIFLAAGGFDPAYRWLEDIELGYRLTDAGRTIRVLKDLQVTHLKHWGPLSLLRSDFFHRALPWTNLIMRYRRFANDLNLRWSARLSVVLVYLMLTAVGAAWWWPWCGAAAAPCAVALLAMNWNLYAFFYRKRGLGFAVRVIPWHWLYFVYSGLAFGIGVIWSLPSRLGSLRRSTAPPAAEPDADAT